MTLNRRRCCTGRGARARGSLQGAHGQRKERHGNSQEDGVDEPDPAIPETLLVAAVTAMVVVVGLVARLPQLLFQNRPWRVKARGSGASDWYAQPGRFLLSEVVL